MPIDHAGRMARALTSLEGLSVGDAFGEQFFGHFAVLTPMFAATDMRGIRNLPLGLAPWPWTDDTAMAVSIVSTLKQFQQIDHDCLAQDFSKRYITEPRRGYGPAMHRLLPQLRSPGKWQTAPRELFERQGSFGNGAAMRVSPLGAYFADELESVAEQARYSAEVTHAHPEGVAGAIAVAVATATAHRLKGLPKPDPRDFLEQVAARTPHSLVALGIRRAINLPAESAVQTVVRALGNGSQVTAQDTVPFVLWSAAHHLDNYEEALWQTVSGLGDMDTTCAMVGGIVVMYTGVEAIPTEWRRNREPLPT